VLDASLNANNGFPLFATVIEANHVSKREDEFAEYKLNQEDRAAIQELGRDPRIGRRVCLLFKLLTFDLYLCR
jgi:DNA replication licensing factor MCM2